MYNTEISGILLFLSQQLKRYFKRASDEGWHDHLGGGGNGKVCVKRKTKITSRPYTTQVSLNF